MKKTASHNFGRKGWAIILYTLLLYFASSILGAIVQISVPALVALRGWDYATLMSFNTIGGWLSIPFTFLFAWVVQRYGVKWPTVAVMAVYGAGIILFGASSYSIYIIAVLVATMLSHSINMVSPNTLISSWFPRKKGVVLGIATSGMMVSSIIGAPLFQLVVDGAGISAAFAATGVFALLVGSLTLFAQNTPQQAGAYPDNDPTAPAYAGDATVNWPAKSLLADKDFWLIAIGFGLGFFALIGGSSFFIPLGLEYGMAQSTLLLLLMLGGIGSIAGSYVLGLLDTFFSTKRSTVVYGVGMVVGMAARALGAASLPVYIFGIFCLTFFQGGVANLMVSMAMQVYGAAGYGSVNRVLSPLVIAIRTLAFAVVGFVYAAAGSYATVCWVFAGVLVVSLLCLLGINPKTKTPPQSN